MTLTDFAASTRSFGSSMEKLVPPVTSLMVRSSSGPRISSGREVMIVDSDAVDHHVRFFHHENNFFFGVTAMIIATVGDDQQRLALMFCLPHLRNPHIDRVQQGCEPFGNRIKKLALNIFDVLREI